MKNNNEEGNALQQLLPDLRQAVEHRVAPDALHERQRLHGAVQLGALHVLLEQDADGGLVAITPIETDSEK